MRMSQLATSIVLALLLLASCEAEKVSCGPGTHLLDGACVPDTLCGDGTTNVDGYCLPNCGLGTVLRGSTCVSLAIQEVKMPFEAGLTVEVAQSFHGAFSHFDAERYAVDYRVDVGTVVVAARPGRVWEIKEDSELECASQPCALEDFANCKEDPCASQGNHVIVDHGDGTFARYWHLKFNGALVKVDDMVCAGQPIGLSGNTGYSTGPHLHFSVTDFLGDSMPLKFAELPEELAGAPFYGGTFTSANGNPGGCQENTAYSSCPTDLFAFMGVVLDPGQPCAVAKANALFSLSGQAFGDWPEVLLRTRPQATEADPTTTWSYHHLDLDDDRNFTVMTTFSNPPDRWWFALSVSRDNGRDRSGFSDSAWIRIDTP